MIDLIRDNIPSIRFLSDMKDFVFDVSWFEKTPNTEIYYMYRGLAKNEKDKQAIEKNDLRYDITVVPSKMLGAEFTKTIGHEHAMVPDTDMSYTEIYEVLEGEAIYLLQKRENEFFSAGKEERNNQISDIYAVKTKAGEKCIIPPNYGHVTINASNQELIMANWTDRHFKSDYSFFKNNRGAGYYALANAGTESLQRDLVPANNIGIKWIKNENCGEIPDIKVYEAKDFNWLCEKFGINPAIPMYNLINDIKKLDFLKHPQKYNWEK
jgi:glucose-6-phosphate isomerase